MAKKESGDNDNKGLKSEARAKMGDIYTAATSTMEAADYSEGYPPRPGALQNKNFATREKRGKD
jgi:hypothetical protein